MTDLTHVSSTTKTLVGVRQPIDHALADFRARPVEAEERTRGEVAVELRAIDERGGPYAVEHLDGQAAGGRVASPTRLEEEGATCLH